MEIKLTGNLRKLVGTSSVVVKINERRTTLGALIEGIISLYGNKVRNILFAKDGCSFIFSVIVDSVLKEASKNTEINENDVIYIIPPMSGG